MRTSKSVRASDAPSKRAAAVASSSFALAVARCHAQNPDADNPVTKERDNGQHGLRNRVVILQEKWWSSIFKLGWSHVVITGFEWSLLNMKPSKAEKSRFY